MPASSPATRPHGALLRWSSLRHFPSIADAVAAERQIKGWSRAKKEAIINGNWDQLPELAKRRG
jgi:putative endonuclease